MGLFLYKSQSYPQKIKNLGKIRSGYSINPYLKYLYLRFQIMCSQLKEVKDILLELTQKKITIKSKKIWKHLPYLSSMCMKNWSVSDQEGHSILFNKKINSIEQLSVLLIHSITLYIKDLSNFSTESVYIIKKNGRPKGIAIDYHFRLYDQLKSSFIYLYNKTPPVYCDYVKIRYDEIKKTVVIYGYSEKNDVVKYSKEYIIETIRKINN